jgi:hypothetical protein
VPRHWRPIEPDNPGPKERIEEVRRIVEEEHHGALVFCGPEKGTRNWWALVDVRGVGNSDKMWEKVRPAGEGKVLLGEDEV